MLSLMFLLVGQCVQAHIKKDAWFTIYCSMRLYAVILILCCRPPGFTVVSLGKCLAGGLQSGCTVKLTGAQYKL